MFFVVVFGFGGLLWIWFGWVGLLLVSGFGGFVFVGGVSLVGVFGFEDLGNVFLFCGF